MKQRFVFIDIDGCITPGKNKNIPAKDISDLGQALLNMSDYYDYVIVTARPAAYAEAIIQMLGLMDKVNHKHAICESGCVVHKFGSDAYSVSKYIDQDRLSNFENELRHLQDAYSFAMEDGRKRTIALLTKGKQTLPALEKIIGRLLPEGIGMHTSAVGIDIMPKKVDKAEAVKKLQKSLKFELEDSISIGDSGGDLPLMKIIGYPSCPQNATKSVKEIVKKKKGYISHKKFGQGVVDILKHYYKKGLK